MLFFTAVSVTPYVTAIVNPRRRVGEGRFSSELKSIPPTVGEGQDRVAQRVDGAHHGQTAKGAHSPKARLANSCQAVWFILKSWFSCKRYPR